MLGARIGWNFVPDGWNESPLKMSMESVAYIHTVEFAYMKKQLYGSLYTPIINLRIYILLYYITLYYIILHYIIFYYIILYDIVLYYIIL